MSTKLELAAIQAVFHRQLSTDRAVRYVTTEAGVSEDQALDAIRHVMVSYKKAA